MCRFGAWRALIGIFLRLIALFSPPESAPGMSPRGFSTIPLLAHAGWPTPEALIRVDFPTQICPLPGTWPKPASCVKDDDPRMPAASEQAPPRETADRNPAIGKSNTGSP